MHSPGSCQGAAAVDEVAPPSAAAAAAAEPSRFELVAGEEGVAAGAEVSISYGSWPSDVFLLFFGFAPAFNPHDSGAPRDAGETVQEQPCAAAALSLRRRSLPPLLQTLPLCRSGALLRSL